MPREPEPRLPAEPVRHLYQICDQCWYNREGGEGRQPERIQGRTRDECPCAICGTPTDSGHYAQLTDAEVATEVPILFFDGPRAGDAGMVERMCVRIYDTFDHQEPPAAVRYDLELVGGELWARTSAVQREDLAHTEGVIRS